MRALIINGQPVPQPFSDNPPPSPTSSEILPLYRASGCQCIALKNITGNITIKPNDNNEIMINSTSDGLMFRLTPEANYLLVCSPGRTVSTDARIFVAPPVTPAELIVTVPQDVEIFIEDICGKVTIHDLHCSLDIQDNTTCELYTRNCVVTSLNAALSGFSRTEINHILGDATITAHDNADILIDTGEIKHLSLVTYGSAFAKIKAPVTDEATLMNAGIHSIHLERVSGKIIASLTGSGDIVIADTTPP